MNETKAMMSTQKQQMGGIMKPFWKIYQMCAAKKQPHRVNKKIYLLLTLLAGWMGGHRYYERRFILGVVYTAFCWTGVPFVMCLLDLFAVLPIKVDASGKIII